MLPADWFVLSMHIQVTLDSLIYLQPFYSADRK